MTFRKACLLAVLLLMTAIGLRFYIPEDLMPAKTMRIKLLQYARTPRWLDKETTAIVTQYIHVGMPIAQAQRICAKNNVPLRQAFRTKHHITQNIYAYVAVVERLNPLSISCHHEIRIVIEVKNSRITDIQTYNVYQGWL
jgi:hypothetical protein